MEEEEGRGGRGYQPVGALSRESVEFWAFRFRGRGGDTLLDSGIRVAASWMRTKASIDCFSRNRLTRFAPSMAIPGEYQRWNLH